jgi:tRNA threonylcarbamoyl adenosine modification protein (Sua5/YciO/YrdC/YwlC family)
MVPAKKTGTAQGVFQGWPEDAFQGAVGRDEGLSAPVSTRSFRTSAAALTHPGVYVSFSVMLTQRIKLQGASADQTALETASAAILDGNLIALPTETFYALSADLYNLRAVERIFQIKGRPDWKALLVLIDSVDQAEVISDNIPPMFYEIAARYWPGPLTLILPAAKRVPLKVTGGTGTVGMRIPNQPFTRSVIDRVRLPIIGTSANLSGHPSCSTAEDVLSQLGGKIELVVDAGDSPGTAASTVLDLTSKPARVVREGAIPNEVLAEYLS